MFIIGNPFLCYRTLKNIEKPEVNIATLFSSFGANGHASYVFLVQNTESNLECHCYGFNLVGKSKEPLCKSKPVYKASNIDPFIVHSYRVIRFWFVDEG